MAESCGAFVSGLHATRLETRTKESNVCASHWVRVETQRRNESESRRSEALAVSIRSHRERDDAVAGSRFGGFRAKGRGAYGGRKTLILHRKPMAGRSPGAPRSSPMFALRFSDRGRLGAIEAHPERTR